MIAWLLDTLVYTGLLIAAVLLVRRPVSRWCGPQIAYSLWALPFLRFIMPPITLPASMAPHLPQAASQPGMMLLADAGTAFARPSAPAGSMLVAVLLAVWLGGAVMVLTLRLRDYVRMRRDLLAEARPVGESGKVRLVETPAVTSPVAFGVANKVVALPLRFMACHDRDARDLAIAHELAHHRGHDLLANLAAQPVLALHWFNPLAWWGWRAMRRDQEAACDARVVAGRDRDQRAAYAQVIASFAAGPSLALAAPMACPMLGEKSIIHRLRSLTIDDVSASRRRIGIAAICTTALALPFTASISYARADGPVSPSVPDVGATMKAPSVPSAPMIRQKATRPAPKARHLKKVSSAPAVAHPRDRSTHSKPKAITRIDFTRQISPATADGLDSGVAGLQGPNGGVAMTATNPARRIAASFDAAADCAAGGPALSQRTLGDGRKLTIFCKQTVMPDVLQSLQKASAEIARNSALDPRSRQAILAGLQVGISQLEGQLARMSGSIAPGRAMRVEATYGPFPISTMHSIHAVGQVDSGKRLISRANAAAGWHLAPLTISITAMSPLDTAKAEARAPVANPAASSARRGRHSVLPVAELS